MNKFSIPAFVEELTQDAANAKYSRAKLKMYYVGETVDHRVFTKDFSDKLVSTIAYTPVVGFYSVADEDFVGHNNVQHIYGIVPADAEVSYVEDHAQGVTFAVTDVILYTGRPDEIGTVASKIVGKQHSLELDPKTVKYNINRDEAGNFKNIEFTEGELIGLSVLGDNDTPAFSGSEFFSAVELPEFITEDNQGKYQALFSAMINVEPTAEEVVTEIYRTLESQRIYGYVCEHKAEDYVVICSDYGIYNRYKMSRGPEGELVLTLDCPVRGRYISDEEIEVLANAKKGAAENFEDGEHATDHTASGTETNEDSGSAAFVGGNDDDDDDDDTKPADDTNPEDDNKDKDDNDDDKEDEEFKALRSNCERLEELNKELTDSLAAATESATALQGQFESLQHTVKETIIACYSNLLDADTIAEYAAKECSIEELVSGLNDAYAAIQSSADDTIFEISNIDNVPDANYSEFDEAAVVQKYKNKNRGKN